MKDHLHFSDLKSFLHFPLAQNYNPTTVRRIRVQWEVGRAYRIGLDVFEDEIRLSPFWGLTHKHSCVQYAAPSLNQLSLQPGNFYRSGTAKSAITKDIYVLFIIVRGNKSVETNLLFNRRKILNFHFERKFNQSQRIIF